MALENMASNLVGWLPRLAKTEAYNLVNDAWMDVRNDRIWSFQLLEDGINSPSVITTGTFTCVLGSSTVTANAAASTAITGVNNPSLTQRQFRVQGNSIYSIIAADFTAPAAVVLTLDRPFTDPAGVGLPYQIFQSLFPAPVSDFKRWIDWRDMTNGTWLDVHNTRREANIGDPQRLYYGIPASVLSYGTDQRGTGTTTPSSTLGYPLYELYPNPLAPISYMRWGLRRGADLIQTSDTLPFPLTEDLVNFRARYLGCQWAEANRDPTVPRGQAADYKFLCQAAEANYKQELRQIGLVDRDIVDLFITRIRRCDESRKLPYYSTLLSRAYSGS